MIIAIDFDGTCVTHKFPFVGDDIGAVPVLQELVNAGHQLILYTMRSHRITNGRDVLQDAIDWFHNHDIPLYGVNITPGQTKWTDSGKTHADLVIDDRTLGAPLTMDERGYYIDWVKARHLLIQMHYLEVPKFQSPKAVSQG